MILYKNFTLRDFYNKTNNLPILLRFTKTKKDFILLFSLITYNLLFSSCDSNNFYATRQLMKQGKLHNYQTQYTDIQLDTLINQDSNIVYTVQVNFPPKTQSYKFIVDTGSPTVISKKLANQLNIKILHSFTDYTFENHPTFYFGEIPLLQIKNSQINNLQWKNIGVVIDSLPENYDGVIGANLMQHAVWEFNLRKKQVKIYDNITQKPDLQGYSEVAFVRNLYRIPKFFGFINQFKQKQVFHLSTGFGGGIKMPLVDFQRKDLLEITYYDSLKNQGIWQSYLIEKEKDKLIFDSVYYANIQTFRVEKLQNQNISTIFGQGNAWHVGTQFLQNYSLIVDWKNRKMYLKAMSF